MNKSQEAHIVIIVVSLITLSLITYFSDYVGLNAFGIGIIISSPFAFFRYHRLAVTGARSTTK